MLNGELFAGHQTNATYCEPRRKTSTQELFVQRQIFVQPIAFGVSFLQSQFLKSESRIELSWSLLPCSVEQRLTRWRLEILRLNGTLNAIGCIKSDMGWLR